MINPVYIQEALRIRREYLTVLREIISKEDRVTDCRSAIEARKTKAESGPKDEKAASEYLVDVEREVSLLVSEFLPLNERLSALDRDQKVLYGTIQEKYPELTDDQIRDQIVPHLPE